MVVTFDGATEDVGVSTTVVHDAIDMTLATVRHDIILDSWFMSSLLAWFSTIIVPYGFASRHTVFHYHAKGELAKNIETPLKRCESLSLQSSST